MVDHYQQQVEVLLLARRALLPQQVQQLHSSSLTHSRAEDGAADSEVRRNATGERQPGAHRWDGQSVARTCIRPLAATPKKSSCRRQSAMGGRDAEAADARAAAAAEGACMVAGAPPLACGISHSMLGCLSGKLTAYLRAALLGSLPRCWCQAVVSNRLAFVWQCAGRRAYPPGGTEHKLTTAPPRVQHCAEINCSGG